MENQNEAAESQSSFELIDEKEALLDFYGSAEDIVQRYTRCAVCGSRLHFSQLTDFAKNLTQETSKCIECGVKVRRVLHKLQ